MFVQTVQRKGSNNNDEKLFTADSVTHLLGFLCSTCGYPLVLFAISKSQYNKGILTQNWNMWPVEQVSFAVPNSIFICRSGITTSKLKKNILQGPIKHKEFIFSDEP